MDKEKEVSLEINGQIKLAKQGSMIIEATDSSGEYVPRFYGRAGGASRAAQALPRRAHDRRARSRAAGA